MPGTGAGGVRARFRCMAGRPPRPAPRAMLTLAFRPALNKDQRGPPRGGRSGRKFERCHQPLKNGDVTILAQPDRVKRRRGASAIRSITPAQKSPVPYPNSRSQRRREPSPDTRLHSMGTDNRNTDNTGNHNSTQASHRPRTRLLSQTRTQTPERSRDGDESYGNRGESHHGSPCRHGNPFHRGSRPFHRESRPCAEPVLRSSAPPARRSRPVYRRQREAELPRSYPSSHDCPWPGAIRQHHPANDHHGWRTSRHTEVISLREDAHRRHYTWLSAHEQ